jgi:hypothetical protein
MPWLLQPEATPFLDEVAATRHALPLLMRLHSLSVDAFPEFDGDTAELPVNEAFQRHLSAGFLRPAGQPCHESLDLDVFHRGGVFE